MLRMERAEIYCINGGTSLFEASLHPLRQNMELCLSVIASAYTSLIGNNDHFIAQTLRRTHQVKNPRNEIKIFHSVNIAMIDIDDPITI